jgi:3',5'-cyclic-AMP phosphodiesterase
MAYVIAQISDIHIGGPKPGNGERFSMAIDEINAMTLLPDMVLLTGDLTQNGTAAEWDELRDRLAVLRVPWEAIPGNHDRSIAELAGHRAIDQGPLRLVLIDSSNDEFTATDASWLEDELSAHPDRPTIVAIHHPPFETGIWWMDCIGLTGAELFEDVVRRHAQVAKVLSGHVHRVIQTNWGSCALWVCPSTAVAIAPDLDPDHDPAETAEPPMLSLHMYKTGVVVSHVVTVGP